MRYVNQRRRGIMVLLATLTMAASFLFPVGMRTALAEGVLQSETMNLFGTGEVYNGFGPYKEIPHVHRDEVPSIF